MTALRPEDWRRVREVFEGALALPAGQRASFVAESFGGDAVLSRHVLLLLASHDRAHSFLETPASTLLVDSGPDRTLEGLRIGPYELESQIGRGGMGEVYRARDTRLDRTVAVKVLPAHAAADRASRDRFEREARAVAALSHPHICALYDVGTHDGLEFLVMEFLDGETLAARLARGPMPMAEAVRVAIQVTSALDRAHATGIIHRDLKPRNIMLTSSGVKLLDFGLAKPTVAGSPAGSELTDLTSPGTILGTLHYMAPEQLEGGATDGRTDLFACGCVLYEMLTGRKAFDAPTAANVMAAIMTAEPPPMRRHTVTVPDQVEAIVARCVAKRPEERWQTARELMTSLELAERGLTEMPVAARGRSRLHRVLLIAGAATVLLVMLAVAQWAFGLRGAAPAPVALAAAPQLAVLPLRTVGDRDNADAHLAVGIADAIITRLTTVRQIGLRPTTAVLSYASTSAEPAKVAEALAVDHVLVGTIQRTAAAYRTTFQLVKSPPATVVWARAYEVVAADLLTLQDTIASQVVEALRIELTSGEREQLKKRYTENAVAYDLYLRGRASMVNYTEAGMKAAIDDFERAVAIDPAYALARSGLATACAWFGIRYAYETDAFRWGERAEREARAALASDPMLAEATLAIASAAGTLYGGFNWPLVIDDAARALALDPSLDLAYVMRMRAFFHLGLFDRMNDEASASRRINPLGNVEIARLEVAASLFSGAYDRARSQATTLLARTDAPVIRNYLGLAQFYLGEVASARETLTAVQRDGRPDIRSQAALASVEAAAGDRTAARRRADEVSRAPYVDHHAAYSLGAAWAQLGDAAAAVKWLQQAADTGFPCYLWLARDPLLDPIRREAAFVTLADRLRQRADADTVRYARGT